MSSVVAVVLATPIIFTAVRRIRVASAWPARAGIGIAAVIAFSALHIAGMVILRKIALAFTGSSYDFGFSATTLIYEFRKDVVTCFLIGGPFWLMESRGDAQAQPAAEVLKPATQTPDAPHMLWLRDGSTRIRIEPRDILWISSAGNYVEYTLANRDVHLIRGTLAATETLLKRFKIARVHRTRLANLERVTAVETRPGGDFELTFDTGQTLTGSRRYRASVAEVEQGLI
jgi:DNA-binding LytR/AlgR family response regulator